MCVGGLIQGAAAIPEIQGQTQEYLLTNQQNEENIRLAQRARADAQARGAKEAGQARMKGGQLGEQQKVAYAASGVDPTQGTAANVMADTRMASELDAQTISNNAFREALGYQAKADQLNQQRKLDYERFKTKVTGTALTGMSRIGSMGFGEGMLK